uniref:Abortive phage infection protein n=1 Tax=Panagrellus redivivus TaxID=6233 RepID=A0A7E4VP88_PANRE
MSTKVVTDLAQLRADAADPKNYQAYIKTGQVRDLIDKTRQFFINVLKNPTLKHSEIKDNFNREIGGIEGGDFSIFFSESKCILGDDLFKVQLDGEYVLLNSNVLEIALIHEPSGGTTITNLKYEQLQRSVKDHFMDEPTKIEIMRTLSKISFGQSNSTSVAEDELNKKLGPRWTVYATSESDAPLHGFAKPGEFIHFNHGATNILVAYHPLTLAEAFENLKDGDLSDVELHGDIAKSTVNQEFKTNLVKNLKGKTIEENVLEEVKKLLPNWPNLVILFGHTVTKPSSNDYAFFTIKGRNLLIIF